MEQGATSAAMSYSRRVDATRRRPTSRLADPHSGERPLCKPTRPNTDGSVSGLDTARRIHFSSRLTNDPARSTTSANSSPPDGLASALPADPRRQYLTNLSTTSTTEQTARSTDTQSARRFRTASVSQRISSIRSADADKTCVLHDFSPLKFAPTAWNSYDRMTHRHML